MKVNKKVFDDMVDAGFMQDLERRAGNKFTSYKQVEDAVDYAMSKNNCSTKIKEGFSENDNFMYKTILVLLVILLIFVVLYNIF